MAGDDGTMLAAPEETGDHAEVEFGMDEVADDEIAGDEALNEYVLSMRSPVTIGSPVRCFSLERIVVLTAA